MRQRYREPVSIQAAAATLLLTGGGLGGAVAYASVDDDFRKLLEESVPGSDQVIQRMDCFGLQSTQGLGTAHWSPRASATPSSETCSKQVEDPLVGGGHQTQGVLLDRDLLLYSTRSLG